MTKTAKKQAVKAEKTKNKTVLPKGRQKGAMLAKNKVRATRAPARKNKLVSAEQAPQALAMPSAAQAIMEALARRFAPNELMTHLETMLVADNVSLTAHGQVTQPAWNIRIKAAEIILAYLVGRPIERQQIIHAQQPMSAEGLIEQARSSPVFLDTLIGMLQDVKAEATNAKP